MAILDLPWKKEVCGPSFPSDCEYGTEYKHSTVPGGGRGWFAKVDIPAGVLLRVCTLKDKTLHRFQDEKELRATGWDIDDAVNYGIGHKNDLSAIFYTDPGTACNHADRTKQPTVKYNYNKQGEMEIWTIRANKAGEEMFIDYGADFVSPAWYEDLMTERKLTPLSRLAAKIDSFYQKPGEVDMKVTNKKGVGFYERSARSFFEGVEGKDGEKKEPVCTLIISGVGDAINTAVAVAASTEKDNLGTITNIQTSYPDFVTFGSDGPIFRGTSRIEITVSNNKK